MQDYSEIVSHFGHTDKAAPHRHDESGSEQPGVLVIDDDPSVLAKCESLLNKGGFAPVVTTDPEAALELTENGRIEAALVDFDMPDLDGLSVLRVLRAKRPDVVVMLMATEGDRSERAVEAVKAGAFDVLQKPFHNAEEMLIRVRKAVEHDQLLRKTRMLEKEVDEHCRFSSLVGHSPRLQHVFRLIEKVAPSDANVLVQGESGTGKELVARSVHNNSHRRARPFVTVNCSALTETLFESELFGHERGAFTGAVQRKRGLFEEAHQGTIFLDEIAEVPLWVQPKLLRVLQEGEVRHVGGNENLHVNVRVIAATNKNLAEEVAAGRFREDLYYRLNVITVDLPPLRERREDIPVLVQHFLQKYSSQHDPKKISTETLQYLENYSWPGNIRELENVVERAIVLEEGGTIQPRDLPPVLLDNMEWAGLKGEPCFDRPYREAKQTFMERFDQAYGKTLLDRFEGNVTAAAEAAGMDRSNFRKILQKAGLDPRAFRAKSAQDSSEADDDLHHSAS